MVTIFASVVWILFDVAAWLLTAPMMPLGEWRAICLTGGALAVLALIGAFHDRVTAQRAEKKHADEMRGLREQLLAQDGFQRGAVAFMGQSLMRLEGRADAAPQANVISQEFKAELESYRDKIRDLQEANSQFTKLLWVPLTMTQKMQLRSDLLLLGARYSIRISHHENTDCGVVARDIREVFRESGCAISPLPVSGTWETAGASGILAMSKHGNPIGHAVKNLLVKTLKTGAMSSETLSNNDPCDVLVIVGPKQQTE